VEWQKCEIQCEACGAFSIPLGRCNVNRLATGRLLAIDGTIDQTTAAMRLKAVFPNEDERLWPGAFVNARVLLETRPDAITVPSVAVQRGPQGLFVWALAADNAVQMQPIAVGPPADDVTIVTAGIDIGDRVVTEGAYRLQAGVKVTVTPDPEPIRAAAIPTSVGASSFVRVPVEAIPASSAPNFQPVQAADCSEPFAVLFLRLNPILFVFHSGGHEPLLRPLMVAVEGRYLDRPSRRAAHQGAPRGA
jgi:hypothetical protein